MDKNLKLKGVFFASLTALMWGFLAIALKLASDIMDAVTISWFRFVVAFSILFVYFLIKKPSYLSILKKPPVFSLIAAFGLAINYIAFIYGLELTSPGTAQVVIQLGPIMLGFVGVFFFKEKLSLRQLIGFAIAGTGLFIFYQDNIVEIVGQQQLYNMGIMWVVVAAMAWITYAILQKKLVLEYPAPQLNIILFGLPILVLFPFISFSGFVDLAMWEWLLLIYLGLNTLIAYGGLALALKYLESNKVSIILAGNPMITFIIMAILAYYEVSWIEPEVLSVKGFIAVIMVIGGGIMAVAFAKKSRKKDILAFMKRNT